MKFQQYDIFRLQDDGTPVWLEPASTLVRIPGHRDQ